MKAWLRRHKDEAVWPEARRWLTQRAIASVTKEGALGWINHCGYS